MAFCQWQLANGCGPNTSSVGQLAGRVSMATCLHRLLSMLSKDAGRERLDGNVLVSALSRLFELEEQACSAFRMGARAVTAPALAERLRSSARTHEQRRDALGRRMMALGGPRPRLEECRPLPRHRRLALERAERDEVVVAELRLLTQELHRAYEKARRELQAVAEKLPSDLTPE